MITTAKGTRDITPDMMPTWQFIENTAKNFLKTMITWSVAHLFLRVLIYF